MVSAGKRRFGSDANYVLNAVTDGFASRLHPCTDDDPLLERICTAYVKAIQQEKFVSPAYAPTPWWEEIRERSLCPVIEALRTRNLPALRAMYSNFFRDPCSAGLIGLPYGMTSAYFRQPIKDIHRHYYLADVLHRIAHWNERTSGRFALKELATAEIGNPFGLMIDGTLVESAAPYRHYCAQRITSLLSRDMRTVAELGGGFGGMTYYLLRDRPGTRYLGFDVPETVALSAYYLMKAFPHLRFLLYGEAEITEHALTQTDVALLPLSELEKVPTGFVDVTFSSHAIGDVAPEMLPEYLEIIARMTQGQFLCIGVTRGTRLIAELVEEACPSFRVEQRRPSGWQSHRPSAAPEEECLYSLASITAPTQDCLAARQ
jgi:putative sugar O-methyltransferase